MGIKRELNLYIEPPVNRVHEQLKVFEEALTSEMQKDLTYITSLEDEYDFLSLNSDIQKEYLLNQFESLKPQSVLQEEKIVILEEKQTSLETENLLLKESLKKCLLKNDELEKKLSCQTARFENSLAKVEKQSLIF